MLKGDFSTYPALICPLCNGYQGLSGNGAIKKRYREGRQRRDMEKEGGKRERQKAGRRGRKMKERKETRRQGDRKEEKRRGRRKSQG